MDGRPANLRQEPHYLSLMAHNPLTPPQVKVCGLTRASDVSLCVSLGVDWLGFNFWPRSKRFIVPEAAAALVAQAQRAVPVGVFVNPSLAEVEHAVAVSGIRFAQLHGDENWDLIEAMPLPVIKAISADRLADWGGLKPAWRDHSPLRYWLIDTPAGSAYGGTGQSFDWSRIASAGLDLPFFLAGGLGPDNVAEAVKQGRPFAVDLNSKVESAPGLKDGDLLRGAMASLDRQE